MADRTDIDALVEDAAEQLGLVRAMYEETLEAQEVPPKLQARIKNVVENQRSALEYLAHQIYETHGDEKGAHSYFPVATSPTQFPGLFEGFQPGVAANCPQVRDAIEERQPYQAGYEWLKHLVLLTNENKHRRLTPQTRTEERRVRVEMQGGDVIEWGPGVTFGSGVSMGGVPVDPVTQRPVPSPTRTVTETIYVGWQFAEPPLSALPTLERIQEELPLLVDGVFDALP